MQARKPYRPRPEWNAQGPHVPLWFRMRIKQIDPRLTLQFIPVRSSRNPTGVEPHLFPGGVWDICIRFPRTGYLSPVAVWSLVDSRGNFAPPGTDTVTLLRKAYTYYRRRQPQRLEEEFDKAIQRARSAKASESKDAMVNAMRSYTSVMMRNDRQWTNRIRVPALRREVA